jgi:hypothetical protein
MSPLSYAPGPFNFNPLSPIYAVPQQLGDRRSSAGFIPQDFGGGYYATPLGMPQQQQYFPEQQEVPQEDGLEQVVEERESPEVTKPLETLMAGNAGTSGGSK